jgi:hypothetical protein
MDSSLYYKLIKLVNGELLVVQTDDSCTNWFDGTIISILNPLLMQSMKFPRGDTLIETYILHPWIGFSEKEIIDIPTRNILVILNPSDGLIKSYEEYIIASSKDNEPSELKEDTDIETFLESLSEEGDQNGEEENGNEGYRSSGGNTRILH